MSANTLPLPTDIQGWTPPDLATLVPVNCNLSSRWTVDYFVSENNHNDTAIDLRIYTDLIDSMMSDGGHGSANHSNIALWYVTVLQNESFADSPEITDFRDRVIDTTISERCRVEFCQELDFEGDADVAGIGMMVSYYIAAVLSTIFFVVFSVVRLAKRDPERFVEGTGPVTWQMRTYQAFKGSLGRFLDAALVFAIGMLGAAAVREYDINFASSPIDYITRYQSLGSRAVAVFSVLPALVLQCAAQSPRNQVVRHLCWFLVVALVIVDTVLPHFDGHRGHDSAAVRQHGLAGSRLGINMFGDDHNGDNNSLSPESALYRVWDVSCIDPGDLIVPERVLTAARVLLFFNFFWWLFEIVRAVSHHSFFRDHNGNFTWGRYRLVKEPEIDQPGGARPESRRRRFGRSLRRVGLRSIARTVNGGTAVIMAWMLLLVFNHYRNAARKITGDSDEGSSWGFGQVVALAAWAPVILDFVTILISGPQQEQNHRVIEKGNDMKLGSYRHTPIMDTPRTSASPASGMRSSDETEVDNNDSDVDRDGRRRRDLEEGG